LCQEKLVVFFAQTRHEYREEVPESRGPNHLEEISSVYMAGRKSSAEKLTLAPNLSNNGPPKRVPPNRKNI
jgi:hypothetical protein